jgi:hypothetical protein
MDSAPRAIHTNNLRPTAAVAARRRRRATMGLPLCLLLGACQAPSAPSDAGPPVPLAVSSAALSAPPTLKGAAPPAPPTALPAFDASRRGDLKGYWLPESWYCRWVDPQDPQGAGKAKEQLDRRAREDARWERRVIDVFSWDSFLAINWPYDHEHGEWLPRKGGEGDQPSMTFGNEYRPYWAGWHRVDELNTNADVLSTSRPWRCEGTCLRDDLGGVSTGENDATDATDAVWDQNGARVEYELRVNPRWMSNRPKGDEKPTFTYGQCKRGGDSFDIVPAVEIKLAWKVLGAGDVPERFFTMRGVKVQGPPEEPGKRSVDLGLVGMHIASKVKTRSWIAMTFEHVDNVPFDTPPEEGRNRWSFHSPTCSGCCENITPPKAKTRRTQLTRTPPIDQDTQALNREVQGWLKARGSVWQYYELVGTQYAHGEPTGKVAPKELRNTVIEPYLVSARGAPGCPSPKRQESSCLGCHEMNDKQDFSFVPLLHRSPQAKRP